MKFRCFLVNQAAIPLFKEEMSLRYPSWRPSFSKKEFLTYKGPVKENPAPWFCRLVGENPQKEGEGKESVEGWSFDPLTPYLSFGTKLERSLFDEENTPSRAYLKMKEALFLLKIESLKDKNVLELGSAPGGGSLALLERGALVTGIDPAMMDEKILENPAFKHIEVSFQKYPISKAYELITCDINLAPQIIIDELCNLVKVRPKKMFITLKITNTKQIAKLSEFRRRVLNLGFENVQIKYLPSYKKEIAFLAY